MRVGHGSAQQKVAAGSRHACHQRRTHARIHDMHAHGQCCTGWMKAMLHGPMKTLGHACMRASVPHAHAGAHPLPQKRRKWIMENRAPSSSPTIVGRISPSPLSSLSAETCLYVCSGAGVPPNSPPRRFEIHPCWLDPPLLLLGCAASVESALPLGSIADTSDSAAAAVTFAVPLAVRGEAALSASLLLLGARGLNSIASDGFLFAAGAISVYLRRWQATYSLVRASSPPAPCTRDGSWGVFSVVLRRLRRNIGHTGTISSRHRRRAQYTRHPTSIPSPTLHCSNPTPCAAPPPPVLCECASLSSLCCWCVRHARYELAIYRSGVSASASRVLSGSSSTAPRTTSCNCAYEAMHRHINVL